MKNGSLCKLSSRQNFTHLFHAFGVGLCEQSINQTGFDRDLEDFVYLGVAATNQTEVMSQGLMFEEWHVWLNRCIILSVLILCCIAVCDRSTYYLLHALYKLWSYLHCNVGKACTVKEDSDFCLLIRARKAYGIERVKRMSYNELLRLHNSHAPLLNLDATRSILRSNRLSTRMKEASLSELSYLYEISDFISGNVEQILSRRHKYVKQKRRWNKMLLGLNQECFDEHTIKRFQFILLVLSLFESTNEDIRTVILYGVPGLPSVSLSLNATYAELRSKIRRRAPKLDEFYFVAHGRIIKIEDTVVDWRNGHLILNVHTCRDLPGGGIQGSSDDERRVRKRKKRCDLH